ncbi:MAG: amidoligase family protein [Actinomycetota bacterium]
MHQPAAKVLDSDPIPGPSLRRVGFEIELLAPPGENRASLAGRLAERCSGTVRRTFHHDTELTLVKDRSVFHHLSLGFDVLDADGDLVCRLVDDITIIDDLDAGRPPTGGWYRILSDDRRLMNLVERVCDPNATADVVLDPVAELFGSATIGHRAGLVALNDADGNSVAAVAMQGGERERVCEIIMPPIDREHRARLDAVLATALDRGFRVPLEAAVHLHFDADPFRSAAALARLVKVFSTDRDGLLDQLGTNMRCRRIGPLPTALVDEVRAPDFDDRSWAEVQPWLHSLDVPKHADVNLRAVAGHRSHVDTVEVRILPGSIDADRIMTKTEQLQGLLAPGG